MEYIFKCGTKAIISVYFHHHHLLRFRVLALIKFRIFRVSIRKFEWIDSMNICALGMHMCHGSHNQNGQRANAGMFHCRCFASTQQHIFSFNIASWSKDLDEHLFDIYYKILSKCLPGRRREKKHCKRVNKQQNAHMAHDVPWQRQRQRNKIHNLNRYLESEMAFFIVVYARTKKRRKKQPWA